jgi:hypothetical protein
VVLVVVVLLLAAGGAFAYSAFQQQAAATARANAARDAETHWEKAEASLTSIVTVADGLGTSDSPDQFQLWESQLDAAKAAVPAELGKVANAAALLPSGSRKAYEAAIADAEQAMQGASKARLALPALADAWSKAARFTSLMKSAENRINSSTSQGNSHKYAAELKTATSALSDLAAAAQTLSDLKVASHDPNMAGGVPYVSDRSAIISRVRAMAQANVDGAKAGKAGIRGARYNTFVDRYNAALDGYNKAVRAESSKAEDWASSILLEFRDARDLVNSAKTSHEQALRAAAGV